MPRTMWALLLTLAIALSGCSGDDSGTDDGTDTTTSTTTSGSSTQTTSGTTQARTFTNFTCDVILGAAVVSGNGIGGCFLTQIESPQQYFSEDVPSGCHVEVDTNDDTFSDEPAAIGKTYQPPSSFSAFCDPGVAQVTVGITLASV